MPYEIPNDLGKRKRAPDIFIKDPKKSYYLEVGITRNGENYYKTKN